MCDIKEQINSIMQSLAARKEVKRQAERRVTAAKRALEDAVFEYTQTYGFILAEGADLPADRAEIELGYHECPDSPTKLCVYNCAADPALDFCLFCGGPDERK